MPNGTTAVSFAQPDGETAAVHVNGHPAGHIRRYDHTGCIWTYDHEGVAFVGTHIEVRKAIQRHYARSAG